MPLRIVRDDISKMRVDAIVNAANKSLQAGGGVCGAIFSAAGAEKLRKACDSLAPIETGEAVITKGYALPAKYIIHAAGPVYHDGRQNEEESLRSCYKKALGLAKKHKCKSIAFPLISSGIYGYPKDEALRVATGAISEWLMAEDIEDMVVSLVVFDRTAYSVSKELFGKVKAYIDENYVDEHSPRIGMERTQSLLSTESRDAVTSAFHSAESEINREMPAAMQAPSFPAQKEPKTASLLSAYKRTQKIDDVLNRLDEPFSVSLFRLIDAKGKTDVEIYKRANLDRKLFSKIRTGKGYMPSKKTVAALAVALELTLPETRQLMERAGFALSRSVVFDVIIEYFITSRKYDVFEINNVLFEYDQPILGG